MTMCNLLIALSLLQQAMILLSLLQSVIALLLIHLSPLNQAANMSFSLHPTNASFLLSQTAPHLPAHLLFQPAITLLCYPIPQVSTKLLHHLTLLLSVNNILQLPTSITHPSILLSYPSLQPDILKPTKVLVIIAVAIFSHCWVKTAPAYHHYLLHSHLMLLKS